MLCVFYSSNFKPAWWLKNPHGQTMLAKLLQDKSSAVEFNETLELPDGDFTELAWTESPEQAPEKAIVVILHGLEGSQSSHYAKGMLKAIKRSGHIAVLMHFRGCGSQPNRQARSYHSGDTRDIGYFTSELVRRYPNTPLTLIGFSLGGNVAIQYLAQQPNNPYKAACIICAPLDLASCSKKINRGMSKLYQKYLLGMLKSSTLKKHQLQPIANICPLKVKSIKTMWQFDDYVTAPLNGFINAEDYYQQVSGIKVLAEIKQPCLIIHAQDDPFLDHEKIIATPSLPNNITFEISQYGGHVGFITGNNPFKPKFWLETRVPEYLTNHL